MLALSLCLCHKSAWTSPAVADDLRWANRGTSGSYTTCLCLSMRVCVCLGVCLVYHQAWCHQYNNCVSVKPAEVFLLGERPIVTSLCSTSLHCRLPPRAHTLSSPSFLFFFFCFLPFLHIFALATWFPGFLPVLLLPLSCLFSVFETAPHTPPFIPPPSRVGDIIAGAFDEIRDNHGGTCANLSFDL